MYSHLVDYFPEFDGDFILLFFCPFTYEIVTKPYTSYDLAIPEWLCNVGP